MLVKTKAQRIRKYLREHGGKDVVIIDLKGESNIADFFVVASYESPTVLKSAVRDIWEYITSLDLTVNARHKEVQNDGLFVIDCSEVVIHLFSEEMRAFYSIEKLWEGYLKKAEEEKQIE